MTEMTRRNNSGDIRRRLAGASTGRTGGTRPRQCGAAKLSTNGALVSSIMARLPVMCVRSNARERYPCRIVVLKPQTVQCGAACRNGVFACYSHGHSPTQWRRWRGRLNPCAAWQGKFVRLEQDLRLWHEPNLSEAELECRRNSLASRIEIQLRGLRQIGSQHLLEGRIFYARHSHASCYLCAFGIELALVIPRCSKAYAVSAFEKGFDLVRTRGKQLKNPTRRMRFERRTAHLRHAGARAWNNAARPLAQNVTDGVISPSMIIRGHGTALTGYQLAAIAGCRERIACSGNHVPLFPKPDNAFSGWYDAIAISAVDRPENRGPCFTDREF